MKPCEISLTSETWTSDDKYHTLCSSKLGDILSFEYRMKKTWFDTIMVWRMQLGSWWGAAPAFSSGDPCLITIKEKACPVEMHLCLQGWWFILLWNLLYWPKIRELTVPCKGIYDLWTFRDSFKVFYVRNKKKIGHKHSHVFGCTHSNLSFNL